MTSIPPRHWNRRREKSRRIDPSVFSENAGLEKVRSHCMKSVHKVAVLGAGTMGARVAAHLADAGVPCFLIDSVAAGASGPGRNKIAAGGLEAARKSKPAAFFEPSLSSLVSTGNFEDDLKRVAEVDWIIEAVIEDLEIKRTLLKKVDALRKPGTIVSTKTSGLPVAKIAEGFCEGFRRGWCGTHCFKS